MSGKAVDDELLVEIIAANIRYVGLHRDAVNIRCVVLHGDAVNIRCVGLHRDAVNLH